jgi:tight adherence protein B
MGHDLRRRLIEAGLTDIGLAQFAAVVGVLFVVGAALGFAVFGGSVPACVIGVFTAGLPLAAYRARRRSRLAAAQEAWPVMIDELRILTGSAGLSVPQALFEVGRRAPKELRSGFEAAHREWLLSTDFARTLTVLKTRLADPTCDATCETLLVASELGGTNLDRRLAALAEDRLQEVQGRKDARARQAGARFARRFVLLVPMGMAVAGLSVGTGRSAYETAEGQFAVVVGLAVVIGCWVWAGRIMRVPDEQRVFAE